MHPPFRSLFPTQIPDGCGGERLRHKGKARSLTRAPTPPGGRKRGTRPARGRQRPWGTGRAPSGGGPSREINRGRARSPWTVRVPDDRGQHQGGRSGGFRGGSSFPQHSRADRPSNAPRLIRSPRVTLRCVPVRRREPRPNRSARDACREAANALKGSVPLNALDELPARAVRRADLRDPPAPRTTGGRSVSGSYSSRGSGPRVVSTTFCSARTRPLRLSGSFPGPARRRRVPAASSAPR